MKQFLFSLFLLIFAVSAWAAVPVSNHVVVVLEENHNYSDVIGASAMPYLNSLASKYSLATNYYADTHPSIGNYFMITTGAIITNDDSYTATVSQDNIVRHMIQGGKTWKSYAEGLPSVGYTGGDTGAYMLHHIPFAYFSDVRNSSAEKQNLVPFTQFATDLANGNLPNLSFVVPNVNNDAHNGTLQQADAWLKTNMAPLLANADFQKDGLLIIVFDEAGSDNTNGGGKVAWVAVGPNVKQGFKSTTVYRHASTLRMIMESLGISSFPGAAASASNMAEFFAAPVPPPAPADFTISATPASQTIARGQSGTYTITVTPVNGFNSAVNLSCPNVPASVSCSFSQNSITPSNGKVTAALTIAASPSAALHHHVSPVFALFLPALGMVIAPAFAARRRRWLIAAGLLAIVALALVGCGSTPKTSSVVPPTSSSDSSSSSGSGSSSGSSTSSGGSTSTPPTTPPPTNPAPVTVNVEVNAGSGSIQHSTTLAVTIQ